ncbi:hypothetical protein E1262_12320 [Jiangella aurantiaca]|uniref:Uncharacterized protein n=1 Tax=Jiangella aurantiaca TaxID=2530373 RepID=A0A4R5ADS7_9ACTN|nr:hypothetical protein [Jiangella aurantiaca]TDD69430.1 hypothetical protein E1262_12320 [Jiangella aurantiaca]
MLTVAACSGGDTEPEAVAATPTPTTDVAGTNEKTNVPPPATRSPGASVLLDRVPFADELSRTGAALPEGAEPVSNAITGPDGATIATESLVIP